VSFLLELLNDRAHIKSAGVVQRSLDRVH
jgi:hypothetical protein